MSDNPLVRVTEDHRLKILASGLSNRAIAREAGVTPPIIDRVVSGDAIRIRASVSDAILRLREVRRQCECCGYWNA